METKTLYLTIEALESGFASEGGVEDYYHFLKNVNGLWIIQECKKKWIRDIGKDISWDDIVMQVSKARVFRSFLNVDEPSLVQPRLDMPAQIFNYFRVRISRCQMVLVNLQDAL